MKMCHKILSGDLCDFAVLFIKKFLCTQFWINSLEIFFLSSHICRNSKYGISITFDMYFLIQKLFDVQMSKFLDYIEDCGLNSWSIDLIFSQMEIYVRVSNMYFPPYEIFIYFCRYYLMINQSLFRTFSDVRALILHQST